MSACNELVAVYGSLKRGFGNHRLLQGEFYDGVGDAEFLGEYVIPEGMFVMRSLGGFPAIFKSSEEKDGVSTPITIEVYRVSDTNMMENLDSLEGHPGWYRRELIDTPFGRSWIYIMPQGSYFGRPIVEDGVWGGYSNTKVREAA